MFRCGLGLALLILTVPEPAPKARSATMEMIDKVPAGYEIEGSLNRGIRFEDENGTNVVLFSERVDRDKGAVFVHVAQWAERSGKRRQLRAVKDWVVDCDFDLVHGFSAKALGVTDLDRDGIKEVTFAYTLDCTSDVSPNQLKLLLLENGDKYIVRGVTRVRVGEPNELIGGDRTLDDRVKKGPEAFRTHLEKVWVEIVRAGP